MPKNIVILSDGTGQGASMPKKERTITSQPRRGQRMRPRRLPLRNR